VKINLVGLSNGIVLSNAFYNAARKQGWTKEDINDVLSESKRYDYDYMLKTLVSHCENAIIPYKKKKKHASASDTTDDVEDEEE
jgi:hypothetical protein